MDREKLRAEAVDQFERWPNLAHYVVDGSDIAKAMEFARDSRPTNRALCEALDRLDATEYAWRNNEGKTLAHCLSRRGNVRRIYRAAIAASCDVDVESHKFGDRS